LTVDRAIERGDLKTLQEVAHPLSPWSYVFEGPSGEASNVRARIAAHLIEASARADLEQFARIEAQGYLLLRHGNLTDLEALVGDRPFAALVGRHRELVAARLSMNESPRVAQDSLTSAYRIRAHLLVSQDDFVGARVALEEAFALAQHSRNESLLISALIDRAHLLREPGASRFLKHAYRVAWIGLPNQNGERAVDRAPNLRRIAKLSILRAQRAFDARDVSGAQTHLSEARQFLGGLQPRNTNLVYEREMLNQIERLHAAITDPSSKEATSIETSHGVRYRFRAKGSA